MMNDDRDLLLCEEYRSRINKVQDYIESNISEEFSLMQLSKIANFSPYHFHRIFCSMTRETLFEYIQRVRLEKAAYLLIVNAKVTITQIALECGFSNQASFAKSFKSYFNMSASKLRTKAFSQEDEDCKTESNMRKVLTEKVCYNSMIRNKQYCEIQKDTGIPFVVEVKDISEMKVVYIRHTGAYKMNANLLKKLSDKLFTWADLRKLINADGTKWLTLFHDTPELTAEDKLRISVSMTVSGDVDVDGEIGKLTIKGGKYAVGHFELNADQYQEAWNVMFIDWLPNSGYQPDDRLCFELYPDNTTDNPQKQMVDIYIPVKPLY